VGGAIKIVLVCVNSCVSSVCIFCSDSYYDVPPMSVKDLSILETVKEVTDFVLVQASHMQFRSLSFLRNLEVINGRKLGRLTKSEYLHFKFFISCLGNINIILTTVFILTSHFAVFLLLLVTVQGNVKKLPFMHMTITVVNFKT